MLQKKITLFLASLGLLAMSAVPAFADNDITGMPRKEMPMRDTSAAVACVGTALNIREAALGTAMMTYTTALNSAYTARATALMQAYALTTGTSTVRTAVKTAWQTFNMSARTARKSWQAARETAWKTFKTAARACKAPAGITDEGNAAAEVVAQ